MNRREFMASLGACAALSATAGAVEAACTHAPMKVLLWCWDTRMTWDDEPEKIQLKMAAAEQLFPYAKSPDAFTFGFRRLIDYCAKNGIWGIVIWGFLRDAHGGIATAKDLCLYANDHGVAVLPGVGLCAYGGYYYDGDHPFNLHTYMGNHPDRVSVAQEERGGREVVAYLTHRCRKISNGGKMALNGCLRILPSAASIMRWAILWLIPRYRPRLPEQGLDLMPMKIYWIWWWQQGN